MKKYILIGILLSLISSNLFAEPTKNETLNYIIDKLSEDRNIFPHIYKFDDNGCTFNVIYRDDPRNGKFQFTLNDTLFYVAYYGEGYGKPSDWGYGMKVKCKSVGCIKHYNSGRICSKSDDMYLMNAYTKNKVLLDKLYKAFDHLKNLCSNKKELF